MLQGATGCVYLCFKLDLSKFDHAKTDHLDVYMLCDGSEDGDH